VLFTDGVTEARNPRDGFYGDERLHARLRADSGATAHEIADRLASEVVAFQDGSPRDDIAIVVAKSSR
jgi:serine phosphatase RsbU (regulator of sigma subunit)